MAAKLPKNGQKILYILLNIFLTLLNSVESLYSFPFKGIRVQEYFLFLYKEFDRVLKNSVIQFLFKIIDSFEIYLYPPTPHVWCDKWICYFIKQIFFGHHFKWVEKEFNNLEWWNQSLFIQIHSKIVEFLYFQAKTSPFLCISCLNFNIISRSFKPPPCHCHTS